MINRLLKSDDRQRKSASSVNVETIGQGENLYDAGSDAEGGRTDVQLEQVYNELEEMKSRQDRYRKQLKSNKEKAEQMKERTKKLILVGKSIERFYPDITNLTDDEISEFLERKIKREGA